MTTHDLEIGEVEFIADMLAWFYTLPEYLREGDPNGARSIACYHAERGHDHAKISGDARYRFIEELALLLVKCRQDVVEEYARRRAGWEDNQ